MSCDLQPFKFKDKETIKKATYNLTNHSNRRQLILEDGETSLCYLFTLYLTTQKFYAGFTVMSMWTTTKKKKIIKADLYT